MGGQPKICPIFLLGEAFAPASDSKTILRPQGYGKPFLTNATTAGVGVDAALAKWVRVV